MITKEREEELRYGHERTDAWSDKTPLPVPMCLHCRTPWPCVQIQMLDTIKALREENEYYQSELADQQEQCKIGIINSQLQIDKQRAMLRRCATFMRQQAAMHDVHRHAHSLWSMAAEIEEMLR